MWPVTDYFAHSLCLSSSAPDTIPLPCCSFSTGGVAINLAYDLNIRQLSIDDTAKVFGLLDLRAAIADFLAHKRTHGVDAVHAISRHVGLWEMLNSHSNTSKFGSSYAYRQEMFTPTVLCLHKPCWPPCPRVTGCMAGMIWWSWTLMAPRFGPLAAFKVCHSQPIFSWSHTLIRTLSCTTLPHNAAHRQAPWPMVLDWPFFDLRPVFQYCPTSY